MNSSSGRVECPIVKIVRGVMACSRAGATSLDNQPLELFWQNTAVAVVIVGDDAGNGSTNTVRPLSFDKWVPVPAERQLSDGRPTRHIGYRSTTIHNRLSIARPKSSTFTVPSDRILMLAGFKSR
jgi:hypothetical protein